jgi:ubiquinone/menaquinone biosynthesis C-methylase UbiE
MSTKPAHVREMFGSIATRYDLANHVLSCGIDFYWRARAAKIVDAIRSLILQPAREI